MSQTIASKSYAINHVQEYIKAIDGIFVEYTSDKFAVIIPLQSSKRIQRVFGTFKYNKDIIEFSSVVCTKEKVDFEKLSEAQSDLTYSKFIKDGDNVIISASVSIENSNYFLIQDVIMEVAQNADSWEKRLTGMDLYEI